ncbi:RING-type domain-containing protein [Mycena chlorophos]|uniref:RING-type domain-containing protein n=1 Tax=Mycena chlorophos TaxID=658473 RepID=A0A8H6WL51_MYCCL|nr:RING-type domain-containing protein [Mycena chlorophos]
MASTDAYDLLIVTDATSSMGGFLEALRTSIPEILALAKLSGAFSRLGVLAYRDYSDPAEQIAAWSGWDAPNLTTFVHNLEPLGGGDFPEAAKTALIRAMQATDKNGRTLMLWYADAPPHHPAFNSYENDVKEKKAFPQNATDWVKLCHIARKRHCTVFCFTPRGMDASFASFYALLAGLTGGICIGSKSDEQDSAVLSRLTVGVIMQWMGRATTTMDRILRDSNATCLQFNPHPLQAHPKLTDENDGAHGYLPPPYNRNKALPSGSGKTLPLRDIRKPALQISDIPVRAETTNAFDPGKRFLDPDESAFREDVYASLTNIIHTNVAALTYNAVFGQLWRAVCKYTGDAARKAELVNAFSVEISKITDAAEKAAFKQWLEESFDQTEEIEKIIKRHCDGVDGEPEMVYLDFDADVQVTRTELLEVSRSCYAGVMKKIARIFTHLKVVEPGVTLAPTQRSLPLSLPARDFFRLLPHLIVPGTLYPARAAGLTAVVALTTGVPFLQTSASELLSGSFKGKWLSLDVPENISFDAARFLLGAPEGVVLTAHEKKVYEAMRRYKLLELNLDAPVEAKMPWTPNKTRGPGDFKVQCSRCLVRRSITIMNHVHPSICGQCASSDLPPKKVAELYPEVSEADSCWVECSTKTCRAQYVVENVAGLKIRPRCHYCRDTRKPPYKVACPWIECSICTNRIVVPQALQPADKKTFVCPGCANEAWKDRCVGVEETTMRALNADNGVTWLGFVSSMGLFEGKSAFKLMAASGESVFGGPPPPPTTTRKLVLTLGGKRLSDPEAVLKEVEGRAGRGEVILHNCALCFEEMAKSKLMPACGRTGCAQLVDEGCLREWYGTNAPGKMINMAQLTCPFCRRKPTLKTMARFNPRVAVLAGVQDAMADRRFIYAWCLDCGAAKRYFERMCCTEVDVAVLDVQRFRCEECRAPPPPPPAPP